MNRDWEALMDFRKKGVLSATLRPLKGSFCVQPPLVALIVIFYTLLLAQVPSPISQLSPNSVPDIYQLYPNPI